MSQRMVDREPSLTVGELMRALLPGAAVAAETRTASCLLRYTLDGRSALALYLKGLEAPAGARILLPGLMCRSVLDAVEAAGWGADFYEVDEDLAPDRDDFWRRVTSRTRAALAVHYFGPAVPLGDLVAGCRERGIALVEDCAHAWQSEGPEGPVGEAGDAAIYSLRKFLPITDGGLLRVNLHDGARVRLPAPRRQPAWRHAQIAKELVQRLAWPGQRGSASPDPAPAAQRSDPALYRALGVPEAPGPGSPGSGRIRAPLLEAAGWDPGAALRRVIRHADPVRIRATRRAHYQHLDREIRRLSHVSPLAPRLPDGACPWAYPVRPACREGFDVELRRAGVPSFTFGDPLPPGVDQATPRADRLRRSVILISCHQGLRPRDLDRILERIAGTDPAAGGARPSSGPARA